jgi:hypothetical protein
MKKNPIANLDQISINLNTAEMIKKRILLKGIVNQINVDTRFKIDDFDSKISYKNINNIKQYLRDDDKKSLLNIICNTFCFIIIIKMIKIRVVLVFKKILFYVCIKN